MTRGEDTSAVDSLLRDAARAPEVSLQPGDATVEPALEPGAKVGLYEINGLLGEGGMARVYRAWDPRLRREVAVKLIGGLHASQESRFAQECQAVASLNHPNVVVVHEAGSHDGHSYVVFELLRGETLRERLRAGAVGWEKAVEWALQIARGLAAAHGRGIIHRDLKPENLFLTKQGPIKILDFGLAKVPEAVPAAGAMKTEEGAVLGTAPYMAPEQVRGQAADQRSDLFAFGAILHEMISGRPLFQRATKPDTMAAVLTEEAVALPARVPPSLARAIARCLAKRPEDRFQSAQDLAFHLEQIAGAGDGGDGAVASSRGSSRRAAIVLELIGAAAAVVAAVAAVTTVRDKPAAPTGGDASRFPMVFEPLTFRRGNVLAARFIGDGRSVVYSASWEGARPRTFVTRVGNREARDLGLDGAKLAAVSRQDELAVLLNFDPRTGAGTLATVSLAGEEPRAIAENVRFATWIPDGRLAVAVRDGAGDRIELPPGRTLYQTKGAIEGLRASPDGNRFAFVENAHPGRAADYVMLLDQEGNHRKLSREWTRVDGLVWSNTSREVFYMATDRAPLPALRGVDLAGKERIIKNVPGMLALHDNSRAANLLFTTDDVRNRVRGRGADDAEEWDLSLFPDWTMTDLSPDGRHVLFNEHRGGTRPHDATFLQPVDGSPAVRLGDAMGFDVSGDGKWIVAITPSLRQLMALPVGDGQPRALGSSESTTYDWARWFPDGRRVLFEGREAGGGPRLFVQEPDSAARPLAPEGPEGAVRSVAISPDGKWVAAPGEGGIPRLLPVDGGEPRALPGGEAADRPLAWSPDGAWLYVWAGVRPARIVRIRVADGAREPWREIEPPDPAGVAGVDTIAVTPDGASYVYGYVQSLSTLYFADRGN